MESLNCKNMLSFYLGSTLSSLCLLDQSILISSLRVGSSAASYLSLAFCLEALIDKSKVKQPGCCERRDLDFRELRIKYICLENLSLKIRVSESLSLKSYKLDILSLSIMLVESSISD